MSGPNFPTASERIDHALASGRERVTVYRRDLAQHIEHLRARAECVEIADRWRGHAGSLERANRSVRALFVTSLAFAAALGLDLILR